MGSAKHLLWFAPPDRIALFGRRVLFKLCGMLGWLKSQAILTRSD
jgi:hypothetical protein